MGQGVLEKSFPFNVVNPEACNPEKRQYDV